MRSNRSSQFKTGKSKKYKTTVLYNFKNKTYDSLQNFHIALIKERDKALTVNYLVEAVTVGPKHLKLERSHAESILIAIYRMRYIYLESIENGYVVEYLQKSPTDDD